MDASLYERGFIYKFPDGDLSLERKPIIYPRRVTDTYHVVKEGQSLIDIAVENYDDPFLWYVIADVNNIDDPFNIPSNTTLLIPNLNNIILVYG